jgi:phosphoglycolate phosphatase-like HAD superfamily hydrolase
MCADEEVGQHLRLAATCGHSSLTACHIRPVSRAEAVRAEAAVHVDPAEPRAACAGVAQHMAQRDVVPGRVAAAVEQAFGVVVLAERIAARTGLYRDEIRRVIAGMPAELQPIVDTVALLRRLQAQGRALYYLSNMPAPFAQRLEDSHDFIALYRHGLLSSRVQLCKPEPAIFEMAQREAELAERGLV